MSSPFSCDLDGFKMTVTKFVKRADDPTVEPTALELAFRAVGLAYLNLRCELPSDLPIAISYLDFATSRLLQRTVT